MGSLPQLTIGCLEAIMNGNDVDKPVVQILGSKCIAGSSKGDRFRLLLTDGKSMHSFAMLATHLNELQTQGQLNDFTICRIDNYITSIVNRQEIGEKRVLIILELTILNKGSEVGKRIEYSSTQEDAKPKPTFSGIARNGSSNIEIEQKPTETNNMNLSQSLSDQAVHPISSLSPYHHRWCIKVRVTSKSAIRTWNNAKGEGKLFSMDLMDESGEIRATVFRDQVDTFYNMIKTDKIYRIAKCQIKPANKQYSTLKNDYEITFTKDTLVEEVINDVDSVPEIKYNFIQISHIADMEPNTFVDTVGVCRDATDVQQFVARTSGKELMKREITLVDDSNSSISLTLWGDEALNFDSLSQPVVLLKNARITEFGGGKSLGIVSSTVMNINPNLEIVHKLRGWFDNGGAEHIKANVSSHSSVNISTDWLSFRDAKLKNIGSGDKPDYFQCKAVIHIIKSTNAVYKACVTPNCNKKVIDQNNGLFKCEKCGIDFDSFKYRLILNMSIGDWTANRWVTCFTDIAEKLLNKSADEIGRIVDDVQNDEEELFASINFKTFIFKLRSKVEYLGDFPRNKLTVVSATPINYKEYNSYLIKNLQELTGIGKN